MGKSKKEKRQAYFFDNKALLALILPLVVEQLLAVLVGMADSIMIASVGEAAVSGVSLVDQIMVLLINAFSVKKSHPFLNISPLWKCMRVLI